MKIKIKVPSELRDIKLSQYQKFIRTTKDSEDDNFIARQLVGIFCNIPDEVVNKMSKKSFDECVNDVTKVLSFDELPLVPIVKHEGVEYGFIPNLEDITVGEQSDLDSLLKEIDKLNLALGVMYRPITTKKGDKYIIEDYEGDGKSLDLPLDVALGASFFLQNLMKDLLNYTQSFIAGEVATDKKLLSLVENGVGIKTFTESLTETFSSLRMYLS